MHSNFIDNFYDWYRTDLVGDKLSKRPARHCASHSIGAKARIQRCRKFLQRSLFKRKERTGSHYDEEKGGGGGGERAHLAPLNIGTCYAALSA